jgi:FkbM family methyltransferase
MEFYKTNNLNQIPNFSEICEKYFGQTANGFIVDVGAHDGFHYSNSYPLITAGWGALMIEPHPIFAEKIRQRYKNIERIIIVEKAASNYKGNAILYDANSLTTLKPEMMVAYDKISWAKGNTTKGVFTVEVDLLNTILFENNISVNFDIFDLDVEGSEEDVLEGFDIQYWKPKMAIIETLEQKSDDERMMLDMKGGNFYKFSDELFIGNGYTKIYVDSINTIYVNENWF